MFSKSKAMTLETRGISKLFGKQRAVDNVSFSIGKGELVGFLGPNGAGKSTTMKIITGYLPADSGEVFVVGERVNPKKNNYKKHIGYLPEHNPLYTDLYIKEYLEITAGFYRLKNPGKCIREMIELTGLGREQHKKIGALSKGYRQRVGLAQALIHDPSILILDEPTTGLDPNQLEEIRGVIREISREKTVILSSHIMQEVEAVCNRIIIINHGKIVADGSLHEIKSKQYQQRQIVWAEFNKEVAQEQLLQVPGVNFAEKDNRIWKIEAGTPEDIRPAIFNFAVENNLILLTLQEEQEDLESVFHQLTQKTE